MTSDAALALAVGGTRKSKALRHLVLASGGVLLLLSAVRLIQILVACDGHFVYPLDDTYIDLQLSDQIAHGHYGLNPAMRASAASSVFYPLLLAALSPLQMGIYTPLVVNLVAAFCTMVGLARLIERSGGLDTRDSVSRAVLLLVSLCVTADLVDLAFIGLEHSIHQLVSLMIMVGVAEAITHRHERPAPMWLVPLCATASFWRFEALDLVCCAIVALAAVGYRKLPALIAAATAASLAIYFAVMRLAGLPLLPSSVLSKWVVTREADGNLLHHIRHAIVWSAGQIETLPLLLAGLVMSGYVLREGDAEHRRRNQILVAIYWCVVLGHMAFGAWGWLGRYSPYMVVVAEVSGLYLWEAQLRHFLAEARARRVWAITLLILCIGAAPAKLLPTSIAKFSRDIYEQQYQLHRLALDYYRAPIAANDVGLLSWHNSVPIVDLWGVSDEETRLARIGGKPGWMAKIAAERGAGLAIIYDQWFPGQVPRSWHRVALLARSREPIVGFRSVSLYATSPEAIPRILAALKAFRPSLPRGVTLTLL